MRAFLCDTRTWGRGSAPLERGHRPCRLSWDKKVVVSGLCHSRSFPGTLSDAAAGLLYLHQDTCSARLRLYSNTPTASLLHLKHRITLVASCHIGLECHDEDWGLEIFLASDFDGDVLQLLCQDLRGASYRDG